jgi:hypothetical protein
MAIAKVTSAAVMKKPTTVVHRGPVGDTLKSIWDQLWNTGTSTVAGIKTTAQAEAYATALAALFDGRPDHYATQDGKVVYYWKGDELKRAQTRIKQIATSGDGKTIVDLVPVVSPVILSGMAPVIAIAGIWLFLRNRK